MQAEEGLRAGAREEGSEVAEDLEEDLAGVEGAKGKLKWCKDMLVICLKPGCEMAQSCGLHAKRALALQHDLLTKHDNDNGTPVGVRVAPHG